MEDTFFILLAGIGLALVIRAITSGRRRPNSYINDHTTNSSDFIYFSDHDPHHGHHHGHHDHGSGFHSSSGDSGSCDSGGSDGGSDGGGGGCD